MSVVHQFSLVARWQRKLQLVAASAVVIALCVLGYLGAQEVRSGRVVGERASHPTARGVVDSIAPPPVSESGHINEALPTVEKIAASPVLAEKLAHTIQNCRHWRVEDSISGRPAGQDPFLTLGTTTTCKELFDRYGDRLDEALYHLKHSPDPVLRGYYYDANYDVLSGKALAFQATLPHNSPARQAFEKLADSHFQDVVRDLDHCSPDSVARMHLSQKLTSPQFANPAVSYFSSRVLMAHDPSDVNLRAYSDRVREDAGLDRQLAARIEASVQRGTAGGCGIGALGGELISWKTTSGFKLAEDPPDELLDDSDRPVRN
jgi:hypothetical protein